jgi:hypothetical protein
MYHFYDKSKRNDDYGEKPDISYTFLFGENSISLFNFYIDKTSYETYKVYSKFTDRESNLSNVSLIEGEYCYYNYKINKKVLSKLSNLNCVTNTNGMEKYNLIFFITNNNQLKYYL